MQIQMRQRVIVDAQFRIEIPWPVVITRVQLVAAKERERRVAAERVFVDELERPPKRRVVARLPHRETRVAVFLEIRLHVHVRHEEELDRTRRTAYAKSAASTHKRRRRCGQRPAYELPAIHFDSHTARLRLKRRTNKTETRKGLGGVTAVGAMGGPAAIGIVVV